jgi:citronellol/citronellal dehydrogenase
MGEVIRLEGKVAIVTGGGRGLGRAMALAMAEAGARVVAVDLVAENLERLETEAAGLAGAGALCGVAADIRKAEDCRRAIDTAVARFGGLDILVNNASAISLTPTEATPAKRFDLMMGVNARGTFLCSQAAIPLLKKSPNAHILTLSPPLNMKPKWFAGHVAYTMSKYGMSMCTLGMAEEFRADGIAVNSLWPKTTIATAAVEVHFPEAILRASRHAAIMADAAHLILTSDARANTGNFYIDEEVLQRAGETDFARYAVTPGVALFQDLFVE